MGQLENLMKLGLTEAEAKQVLEDDKRIDRGEKMPFDLTKEQEKDTRQYRQSDRKKPMVPNLTPRERKPNNDKRYLIDAIEEMLTTSEVQADEVVITNPDRQSDFTYNGVKYRVVLSAPRK